MFLQEEVISILNRLLNHRAKIRHSRNGTEAVYFCPACKHYKRKLEININTEKYGCWVCGFSGISFYSLLKKLNAPKNYYVITENKVKNKEGLSTEFDIKKLFEEQTMEYKTIYSLPQEFLPLYVPSKSIEYKNALHYLKNRNITKWDIYRYNIGYCEEGKYRNRIIIPSYDKDGNLNFFSGRSYYDGVSLKYLNCDFDKDIIGFELQVNFSQEITIVEGAFDAIAVRNNCIPLFGKTLSEKLKMELIKNKPPKVNIMLDVDAVKDSVYTCEYLLSNGVNVYFVNTESKDASVLGFDKSSKLIDNASQISFDNLIRMKINL